MSLLSSRLLTTWLAETSCSSDNLILYTLLAWRSAAVIRVFVRAFILSQAFRKFISSVSFLRTSRFRAFMLRFNLIISAYCWLTVARNNHISSVMPCNNFDMSVTCSFIGIKVQRKSEIRKKNKHIYSLYTKILEEKIQTDQYRWIVMELCSHNNYNYITAVHLKSVIVLWNSWNIASCKVFQSQRIWICTFVGYH